MLLLASDTEEENLTHLRMVLRCAVEICKSCTGISDVIVQTLTNLIGLCEGEISKHFIICSLAPI